MNLEYYINKIKFELTGGVLESELTDNDFALVIQIALQEMNRYYSQTGLVLVPASQCIDLKQLEEKENLDISSIAFVYRTKAKGAVASSTADPMYNAYWNQNSYIGYSQKRFYNYLSYNTLNQLSNTVATDLDFREDPIGRKLYVYYSDTPDELVLEYVPKLHNVGEVVGEYWIDILTRMSLAYAKITLGRVRTRFVLSDALWTQDGETLLAEGREELKAIQDRLQAQDTYINPLD